jgi:peroxiredoxin
MKQQHALKLYPGTPFPDTLVTYSDGQSAPLGQPADGFDWRLVVVYRGRHCPLCTKYLNQLQAYQQRLADIGVDLVAVSGDSQEQLTSHMNKLDVNFPLAYGLTLPQMETLGAYVSDPRSPEEADHPFAEPALFVVNKEGTIQVVDYSNNPFVRPEPEALVNGLAWIRNPDNNYPIRGMRHQAR